MKGVVFLVLFSVMSQVVLAQTEQWVIQGKMHNGGGGTIEFYFYEGPLNSPVQIGYTHVFSVSEYRALVELPEDVDISRMVILIRYNDMQWKALSYGGLLFPSYLVTWGTFNFNGETLQIEENFEGNMYKLNSLVADETDCNVVRFKNDYNEYVGSGSFPIATPTFTYTITDSVGRTRILPQSGPVANVTVSDMESLFGPYFSKGMNYRMQMRDGDFPTHTVPFRMRSAAPIVDFSTSNAICTTDGEIFVTGSTIDTDIDRVAITINGLGAINVNKGNLNDTIIHVPEGNYNIQVENISMSDPEDNCSTEYNNLVVTKVEYTLTPQAEITPNTCNSDNTGFISIQNNNGSQPYQYAWSRPSDGNIYPGFNASSTLNGIEGNESYSVTVTDSYGCTGSINSIFYSEPGILSIANAYATSNDGDGTSCHPLSFDGAKNDGVIEVEAGSVGTGVTRYNLIGSTISRPYQTSTTFSNLVADTYTIQATDDNGCLSEAMEVELSSPALLSYGDIVTADINCNSEGTTGGMITVSGSNGGTGGYQYSLDNLTFYSSNNFDFVNAGPHRVYIKDNSDCVIESEEVTITSNSIDLSIANIDNVNCPEDLTGSITVALTGGLAPYQINWSDGQSSLTATNLAMGSHKVIVIDNKGCELDSTILVDGPAPLIINDIQTPPTCAGDIDGSIVLSASGGNGGYIYTWSDETIGAIRTNLSVGNYSVVVSDQLGCQKQYEIVLLPPPGVDLGEDRTICSGHPVTLSSNVPGTYEWSSDNGFSSTVNEVIVGDPGVYRLVVTDVNNCISEDEIVITTSTDLMTADFLMVSEAYEGDTIVLIDISWPAPDATSWSFPSEANVVTEDDFLAELTFEDAGVYTVSLSSKLGSCWNLYESQVIVLEGERPTTGGRVTSDEIIRSIRVNPNPTSGVFEVAVDLREAMPIEIRVVSVAGAKVLLHAQDEGSDFYEWNMNIENNPTGVYFISVRAGGKVKIVRLVKL